MQGVNGVHHITAIAVDEDAARLGGEPPVLPINLQFGNSQGAKQ